MRATLFLLLASLLCSCSDPVQVTVSSRDQRPLVFDGTDTLAPKEAVDSIALSSSAEHTCTTADQRTLSFRVGTKPGLLNPDSNAFVVFSIDYRSDQSANQGPKIIVGYVLVDSFLVYRKPFPQEHLEDELALRIAERVREKGNYAEAIMPMGRRPLKSYATSKDVAGVRSIGPDQVFTERFWDYDLGQEIPSTITASVQEGMEKFDTERKRTAIMEATKFLVFASLSPDVYEVIDLRRLKETSVGTVPEGVPAE
ncbi:MAG: hypothetical protein IPN38_03660 [Flavobacteriales bacterium]|nr:hypothetical protein [Flavobacteriales bacterium]